MALVSIIIHRELTFKRFESAEIRPRFGKIQSIQKLDGIGCNEIVLWLMVIYLLFRSMEV